MTLPEELITVCYVNHRCRWIYIQYMQMACIWFGDFSNDEVAFYMITYDHSIIECTCVPTRKRRTDEQQKGKKILSIILQYIALYGQHNRLLLQG